MEDHGFLDALFVFFEVSDTLLIDPVKAIWWGLNRTAVFVHIGEIYAPHENSVLPMDKVLSFLKFHTNDHIIILHQLLFAFDLQNGFWWVSKATFISFLESHYIFHTDSHWSVKIVAAQVLINEVNLTIMEIRQYHYIAWFFTGLVNSHIDQFMVSVRVQRFIRPHFLIS